MTFLSCEQTLTCLFESVEKIYKPYGKKNGIILPRNFLKFPLVKIIVSKIAFLSDFKLAKTKLNSSFLRFFSLQKMKLNSSFLGFCNLQKNEIHVF